MAISLAELIVLGLLVDFVFRRLRIPALVGILLLGVIMGPYFLELLKPDLLSVSSDLRTIALIVILLRAGFELNKDILRKVGVRIGLLSAVPAVFEGTAIFFLGPRLLGLSYLESAILGAVIGAVAPAVVVPLMIDFMDRRKGMKKGIPTLLIAASSIDDVFVIVIYSALIGIYTSTHLNLAWQLASMPLSILSGIAVGLLCGWVLYWIFKRFNPRATKRLLLILGIAIFFVSIEPTVEAFLPFAALLAVLAMGASMLDKNQYMARELSGRLAKLWIFAEILLFVLVGAQVDISLVWQAGLAGSALIGLGLVARSIGVYVCLFGSGFTLAEKVFVIIAYTPKATVQAVIGGAPLIAMRAAGMNSQPGELILAVAVLSILLTAPLGAWATVWMGNRVLQQEQEPPVEEGGVAALTEDQVAALRFVEEIMDRDIATVRETERLSAVFRIFADSDFVTCPVVDLQDRLVGVICLQDLRPILLSQETWELWVAQDACRSVEAELHPTTSLAAAVKTMKQMEVVEMPVVEPATDRVVGLLNRDKAEKYIQKEWLAIGEQLSLLRTVES